ncbi:MAG: 30S ribosomal protein S16 [Ktedonobacteraceae bacterium]
MTVKIRLKRVGKKKAPSYRVVVADSRFPRDGRIIENIGWYNPMVEPSAIHIDAEKALGWLKEGAQPTDSVASLLKRAGVTDRFEQEKAAAKPQATE